MSWLKWAKDTETTVGVCKDRVVLEMSGLGKLILHSENARELARKLVIMADMLDPPAPAEPKPTEGNAAP